MRPNQGLILPGQSEQVQILLVEKDKMSLWQSYERLGQSALDSSKDKFLVQSTRVAPDEGLKAGDYEKLSNYWTKVMSNTSAYGVFNTKLPVKLLAESATESAAPATKSKSMPKTVSTSSKDVNSMNSDQLKTELTNLRSKYDELVSFSVNLTAERDILNNTLEQTKRELNKYLHKSAANDNRSNSAGGADESSSAGKSSSTLLYLVAILFWVVGAYMGHRGQTKILSHVPGMSGLFPVVVEATVPTPVADEPPKAVPDL